ncbi:hypothetical protein AB4Z48_34575 [Cupriavidus sp. 2TAF22]|uniref:hypothetical protein n=1 Tax=unclassified Cupriavidus TaxID=2640874 RepID=UPI003F9355D5
MHQIFSKTLLTASALASTVLCTALARAEARVPAPTAIAAPAHTGQRDAFVDGARTGHPEAIPLAALGRQGLSACISRKFDSYQDGLRSTPRDPYADGGRMGQRDAFTDGARGSQADPYSSGAECVSALQHGGGASHDERAA